MDNISTSYNLEVSYTYVESNLNKIMALIEEIVTKLSLYRDKNV